MTAAPLSRPCRKPHKIAKMSLIAEGMTGRIDFDSYTPDELKHIFTRYNQNTGMITEYGNTAYQYYTEYKKKTSSTV